MELEDIINDLRDYYDKIQDKMKQLEEIEIEIAEIRKDL